MPMVGVPIAAAICIRPKSFEIATLAAAIARMPLRRSVPVRSRTARSAGGDDLGRQRLFARGRRPPRRRGPARRAAARLPGNRSSAWRRRPSPAPAPPPGRCRGRWPAASGRFPRREPRSCGTGHSGGNGAPSGSASAAFLSMKRGRRLLAPAPAVEQAEPGFADKSHPFRNAGQRRRNRRFPGPGQHQRGAVVARRGAGPPAPIAWRPPAGSRGRSQTMPARTPGM